MSIQNLEEDILKIWGHHTEFSAKGNRYVAFVLQHQIDELIEVGFTDEAMDKELADMALVILRHWSRRGQSSEEKIRARLSKRHEGKTDQIKDNYLKLYENFKFPQDRLRAASEELPMKIAKNIAVNGMRCFSQTYSGCCLVDDIDDLANDIIKPIIEAALRGEAEEIYKNYKPPRCFGRFPFEIDGNQECRYCGCNDPAQIIEGKKPDCREETKKKEETKG